MKLRALLTTAFLVFSAPAFAAEGSIGATAGSGTNIALTAADSAGFNSFIHALCGGASAVMGTACANQMIVNSSGQILSLDSQSGTWNITNISGTISLPTGAATSALQTTINNSLATINTTLNTPMQMTGGTVGLVAGAATIGNVGLVAGAATVGNVGLVAGSAAIGTVSPTTASLWGIQTQGSTTSGQSGDLTLGAVTTAAPTYTTGQTSALSLDTSGNLRVVSTGGSGVSAADRSTFTAGASNATPVACQTAASPPTLTSGLQGTIHCDGNRDVFINVESGSFLANTLTSGVFSTPGPQTEPLTGVLTGVLDVNGKATENYQDPCLQKKSFAHIKTSTGTGIQLVAGVSGKKTYICGGTSIVTSAAAAVSLIGGTNSTCSAGQNVVFGNNDASINAANGMDFAANGGISPPGTTVGQSVNTGDYLCVLFTTTNTPSVTVSVAYVQE